MTCRTVVRPNPGSFFLTRQTGRTGRLVAAAQALVRGASTYTHAGIVLRDGQVLEALPGGARISTWDKITASGPVLVCDRPVRDYVETHRHMGTQAEVRFWIRHRVVDMAMRMVGVQYSWLDYLAIAMAEWRVPGWQLVRRRVESSERLICSALVDRVYAWAGVELFDDGRLAGDVTPWDLDEYARGTNLVLSC
jgi:cell wall-associated NlpC family hydrolase